MFEINDEEFKSLLEKNKQKNEEDKIELPEKIQVKDYVLRKAQAVCDAVRENYYRPYEWYGFLISKRDNLEVVDDLIIKEQYNTSASTRVDGEYVAKASLELKEKKPDYLITGWIHSHANISSYFSLTDEENIKTVINTISLNTRKRFMKDYHLIEGKNSLKKDNNSVVLSGDLSTDPVVSLSLPIDINNLSEEEMEKLSIKIKQPVLIGWAYNIVVNDRGEKRGRISFYEEHPLEGKKLIYYKEAGIVDIYDPREINLEEIVKEVEDKIKVRKVWSFWYPQRKRNISDELDRRSGMYKEWGESEPAHPPHYSHQDYSKDLETELNSNDVLDFISEISYFIRHNSVQNHIKEYRDDEDKLAKILKEATGVDWKETTSKIVDYSKTHPEFKRFVQEFQHAYGSLYNKIIRQYYSEMIAKKKLDKEVDKRKGIDALIVTLKQIIEVKQKWASEGEDKNDSSTKV